MLLKISKLLWRQFKTLIQDLILYNKWKIVPRDDLKPFWQPPLDLVAFKLDTRINSGLWLDLFCTTGCNLQFVLYSVGSRHVNVVVDSVKRFCGTHVYYVDGAGLQWYFYSSDLGCTLTIGGEKSCDDLKCQPKAELFSKDFAVSVKSASL